MKTHLLIGIALILAMAAVALAQSPFDGTWKIDNNEGQNSPRPPIIVALQDGIYQESTQRSKISIKADGTDQPVQGAQFIDAMAVKVLDDKTIVVTRKMSGEIVSSFKHTVSADGKTFTREIILSPLAANQSETTKLSYVRVAEGPAGSHSISGTWNPPPLSLSSLPYVFKSSPNGLMLSQGVLSYDAKFDGKEYPINNTADLSEALKKIMAGLTVSLTKVNEYTFIETDKRNGQITEVDTYTVSPDGKTLTPKMENKERGTTRTITATK